ncbi:hypothetical protein OS493_015697 [Desmophyllum pertusum]|uniref:Uncharacterized protein n=1 Tax=Desmophyllum pertusum TaxID=174260 RepID=A0A9W9YS77_9CNID|nr:hypothetical protein OS493_015697 [Desmophyllum pertusum]
MLCKMCSHFFHNHVFTHWFILTMVGHLAKPFWGPEDDWCDFCREDRLATENNLKNCRTVGPIFLAIGGLLLLASIFYCRVKKKSNEGQVIMGTPSGQMGPTSQGGTGTTTAFYSLSRKHLRLSTTLRANARVSTGIIPEQPATTRGIILSISNRTRISFTKYTTPIPSAEWTGVSAVPPTTII